MPTEVRIELKPDHGIVPYHIGIMKLQKLDEALKENENKSALTAHINKSFADVAVVTIEEIGFVEFRYTLTMKFSVENEIKELEALGKATLEGILELFPFMNILDVQLKYYFDSLKKDFGEETKTKRGDDVCSGIALPLQVNLFQKHLFLYQLTHNMTKYCSLIYQFLHENYKVRTCCVHIFFVFVFVLTFKTIDVVNIYF